MRIRPATTADIPRLAHLYRRSCSSRPELAFLEPSWQTNPDETTNGIISRLLNQLEDETTIIVVAELGAVDIRSASRHNTTKPVAWMAMRWETSDYIRHLRGVVKGIDRARNDTQATRSRLNKLVKVERTWEGAFPGWWEVTILVEHPDYVDRNPAGELLQWASIVAEFEGDALTALVGSDELVREYQLRGLVPYRRIKVREGEEEVKVYEMERLRGAGREYSGRAEKVEPLSGLVGGFVSRWR
ncbi:hypothetical protein B0T14DRAFT_491214 [Immersiella caudata]|uniref:Uncharacterized protein n=1 Tax=Immersiella caudata TaxID=314043 RepID=A0AA39XFD3_9PEZI|nr:hypothetical protein B0T14DRAFT_491214 [Immersiella caudata]